MLFISMLIVHVLITYVMLFVVLYFGLPKLAAAEAWAGRTKRVLDAPAITSTGSRRRLGDKRAYKDKHVVHFSVEI